MNRWYWLLPDVCCFPVWSFLSPKRIGDIPQRGEPHKMFTFCTSTVYIGADFYSTNAYLNRWYWLLPDVCCFPVWSFLSPKCCWYRIRLPRQYRKLDELSQKTGMKFRIGDIPQRGEPHKMFTFCTSTVYIGVCRPIICCRSTDTSTVMLLIRGLAKI